MLGTAVSCMISRASVVGASNCSGVKERLACYALIYPQCLCSSLLATTEATTFDVLCWTLGDEAARKTKIPARLKDFIHHRAAWDGGTEGRVNFRAGVVGAE